VIFVKLLPFSPKKTYELGLMVLIKMVV